MGAARVRCPIWVAKAGHWFDVQERVAAPLYKEVLREGEVRAGGLARGIGCCSGIFCEMDARLGAADERAYQFHPGYEGRPAPWGRAISILELSPTTLKFRTVAHVFGGKETFGTWTFERVRQP